MVCVVMCQVTSGEIIPGRAPFYIIMPLITKIELAISAIGKKNLDLEVVHPSDHGYPVRQRHRLCMVPIRLGSFDPCDPATGPAQRARHGACCAPTVAGVRHDARGILLMNPSQAKPSEWFGVQIMNRSYRRCTAHRYDKQMSMLLLLLFVVHSFKASHQNPTDKARAITAVRTKRIFRWNGWRVIV